MNSEEMEQANICPKCGAAFYDGCFCSPRGPKRATGNKDQADDADAARYMRSTLGERLRMSYAEAEPSDALNENNGFANLGDLQRSCPTPPPSPTAPPETTPSPPPPSQPLSERITAINRRGTVNPPEQTPPVQTPDASQSTKPATMPTHEAPIPPADPFDIFKKIFGGGDGGIFEQFFGTKSKNPKDNSQ